MKIIRSALIQFSLLLVAVTIFSCGAKQAAAPTPAPVPEPVVAAVELPPVEAPALDEGLIAYVSGIVDITDGTDWFPAEIGDMITIEDRIKTGPDSSCEIQFGTTAVIHLKENTEISVSRISLTPESNKVGLNMVAGSVLAKVQKLAEKDSFSVRTSNTVCGVRGTEFSVSEEPGQKTVLAVKEGSVAVLPPELDVEVLKEQVAGKGETAQAVIDQILAEAPKVEANQEMALTEEYLEETREIAKTVTKAVSEIAEAKDATEAEAKTRQLAAATVASTKDLAMRTAPAAAISTEKAEALKQTDKMKILDIPVAATREDKATQPRIQLYKVGIKVQPSDARIILNGESAATGNFSALYEAGTSLSFSIEREGYAPYSLPLSVSPDDEKLYTIQLAALVIEQTPEKAAPEAATPAPAVPEAEKEESPEEESASLTTNPETEETVETAVVEAEEVPRPVPVRITTLPVDALISINGAAAQKGSITTEALPGSELSVSVSRRGFTGKTAQLTIGETPVEQTVNLQGQPLLFSLPMGKDTIRGIAASKDLIVLSNAGGTLSAADVSGNKLWTLETPNKPNENSIPVMIDGNTYFSGAKTLIVVDSHSGNTVQSVELDSNRSHLFGRKVTSLKRQVLYPSNNTLEVFNPAAGNFTSFASIPGEGSKMSPGIYGNSVLIADQQGSFLIFENGTVQTTIPTGAVQPVALAVSVNGSRAVFSGRKGTVVCIDLTSRTVLWEQKLSDENVSVTSDIALGNRGAYVFGRDGAIYGLDLDSGSSLFAPIRGASAPPLYLAGQDQIVYGTGDNKLIFAAAATGKTVKSLTIESTVSSRPVLIPGDTLIAVGTRQGQLLLIEPAGIQ